MVFSDEPLDGSEGYDLFFPTPPRVLDLYLSLNRINALPQSCINL